MNFNILESYAMSNSDIFKVIGKSSVIKYPQFGSMSHIDECFDSQGRCVIFFETVSNKVGHWECLYKDGTTINFFDSYGIGPDVARKYLSKTTQINLKETKPLLTNLIKKSGYDCIYSGFDYQSWKGNVETCGKHVSIRLLNKDKSNEDYYDYLQSEKDKLNVDTFDEVVEELIYNFIGK